MIFIKKLDSWINYCFKNDGWTGLLAGFLFITELYIASLGLPLSKFGSIYRFLLIGFCYSALAIGAIRLIRKRKIKNLADEHMTIEIAVRQTEKQSRDCLTNTDKINP